MCDLYGIAPDEPGLLVDEVQQAFVHLLERYSIDRLKEFFKPLVVRAEDVVEPLGMLFHKERDLADRQEEDFCIVFDLYLDLTRLVVQAPEERHDTALSCFDVIEQDLPPIVLGAYDFHDSFDNDGYGADGRVLVENHAALLVSL